MLDMDAQPICMFKNIQILLDIVCSYMIVIVRLVEKLYHKKDGVMQWHMQAGNITTNLKVEVDLATLNLARQMS